METTKHSILSKLKTVFIPAMGMSEEILERNNKLNYLRKEISSDINYYNRKSFELLTAASKRVYDKLLLQRNKISKAIANRKSLTATLRQKESEAHSQQQEVSSYQNEYSKSVAIVRETDSHLKKTRRQIKSNRRLISTTNTTIDQTAEQISFLLSEKNDLKSELNKLQSEQEFDEKTEIDFNLNVTFTLFKQLTEINSSLREVRQSVEDSFQNLNCLSGLRTNIQTKSNTLHEKVAHLNSVIDLKSNERLTSVRKLTLLNSQHDNLKSIQQQQRQLLPYLLKVTSSAGGTVEHQSDCYQRLLYNEIENFRVSVKQYSSAMKILCALRRDKHPELMITIITASNVSENTQHSEVRKLPKSSNLCRVTFTSHKWITYVSTTHPCDLQELQRISTLYNSRVFYKGVHVVEVGVYVVLPSDVQPLDNNENNISDSEVCSHQQQRELLKIDIEGAEKEVKKLEKERDDVVRKSTSAVESFKELKRSIAALQELQRNENKKIAILESEKKTLMFTVRDLLGYDSESQFIELAAARSEQTEARSRISDLQHQLSVATSRHELLKNILHTRKRSQLSLTTAIADDVHLQNVLSKRLQSEKSQCASFHQKLGTQKHLLSQTTATIEFLNSDVKKSIVTEQRTISELKSLSSESRHLQQQISKLKKDSADDELSVLKEKSVSSNVQNSQRNIQIKRPRDDARQPFIEQEPDDTTPTSVFIRTKEDLILLKAKIESKRELSQILSNGLEQHVSEALEHVRRYRDAQKVLKTSSVELEKLRCVHKQVENDKNISINTCLARINEGVQLVLQSLNSDGEKTSSPCCVIKQSGGVLSLLVKPPNSQEHIQTSKLSGGQKALFASALSLGLGVAFPSPLYAFDEIDAALDAQHASKIGNLLSKQTTCTICVTLRHHIYKCGRSLVGVYHKGKTSRTISQNFND